MAERRENPLETKSISRLILSFCIPSLASSLVTCVYNIVDQLFIGKTLGVLGNAATSVVFPVVTLISAISLMCGVGPSNAMNIRRGRGDLEEAGRCVGGGFGIMVLLGLICTIPMLIWTKPLLTFFGCTETVMPYAVVYGRIIALGFIFSIIGAAGPFLVRADGSPMFALVIIATGAILNIFLDALFIFGFHWGIAGAAWATILAQAISAGMVIWYVACRFRTLRLKSSDFKPDFGLYGQMMAIGAGPAFNFGTQAIVQVFLNNALRKYGAESVYGSDICLAVAGVANKVNTLANALIIGMTNGLQPISSYHFGKKNYKKVAEAGKKVVGIVLFLGFFIFLAYQLVPRQITSFFGEGNDVYFEFAEKFFRIFFMMIMLYGLQSSVAGFFSSQGKVRQSVTISLVRQVLFFPAMLLILPRIFGIDGVLYAGPVADLAMAATAGTLFIRELKILQKTDPAGS